MLSSWLADKPPSNYVLTWSFLSVWTVGWNDGVEGSSPVSLFVRILILLGQGLMLMISLKPHHFLTPNTATLGEGGKASTRESGGNTYTQSITKIFK